MNPLPRARLNITSIEAFVFRSPIDTPVRTSFGTMRDRPAVFVRVVDADGTQGWGEIWCNFPTCGAEHRARLLDTVMAPLLLDRVFGGPVEAFDWLSERTAVLAIQCGEPGPIAQTIAGIDTALWDLTARRAGLPLWRYLGGADERVGVYASGINPDRPQDIAAACRADGHRAFKLKIGFDTARDLANVAAVREVIGADLPLMADANQAWPLEQACAMARQLEPFGLSWLEEPLRADQPWSHWRTLAEASRVPLAAGENLAGAMAFDDAIEHSPLTVLQPDLAKWGGISGSWPVIARARQAGLRYCPHYLGGGIGLTASAHLLAAAGGDGLLEVDANPNPLRTDLAPMLASLHDGRVSLGHAAGLGVLPDLARLARIAH